jgi:hypothetical protein
MHEWLGWVFIGLGVLCILIEVMIRIRSAVKPMHPAVGAPDYVLEIIKKLPWVVIVGLILIYLGLYIIGAPLPIKIVIGGAAGN